jgi:hypothetical protein
MLLARLEAGAEPPADRARRNGVRPSDIGHDTGVQAIGLVVRFVVARGIVALTTICGGRIMVMFSPEGRSPRPMDPTRGIPIL